jgi:hypothetical protein
MLHATSRPSKRVRTWPRWGREELKFEWDAVHRDTHFDASQQTELLPD